MFFNQESKAAAAAKELKAKTKVADNDDDLAEIFYYVEEGGKKPIVFLYLHLQFLLEQKSGFCSMKKSDRSFVAGLQKHREA